MVTCTTLVTAAVPHCTNLPHRSHACRYHNCLRAHAHAYITLQLPVMRQLKVLTAARCALRALPVGLGSQQRLEQLDVSDNSISDAPRASLAGLFKLTALRISHNRLTVSGT
jgi:Leucine-rich repeat (LRR) protein